MVIYGDYVVLEKDENADSASIKVPNNATSEYHTGEAVYIRGSGYVYIVGVEIGGGAAENSGIGVNSSFLRIREGTTIHQPTAENRNTAIYAENSYIDIRTDSDNEGDIAINGRLEIEYNSDIYIKAESSDITVDGRVTALYNSTVQIRDVDSTDAHDITINDEVYARRNSTLRINGSANIEGNISATNGVIQISNGFVQSGDGERDKRIGLFLNSSLFLADSTVDFVRVSQNSGAYINNSNFYGMSLWLGSTAYIDGTSKTEDDIKLYNDGAEIYLSRPLGTH